MIRATFTFCRIDGKPIDRSPPYKLLRFLTGERFASRFTFDATFPIGDDDE